MAWRRRAAGEGVRRAARRVAAASSSWIGWVVLLVLATPAAAEQAITLHLHGYAFEPAVVEVEVGEPVRLRLVNDDRLTPHNFTLAGAGVEIRRDVAGGEEVVVLFTPHIPGRFPFYCDKRLLFLKSHRARGMEATLVVRSR